MAWQEVTQTRYRQEGGRLMDQRGHGATTVEGSEDMEAASTREGDETAGEVGSAGIASSDKQG